jgi:hypothetical protein
LLACRPAWLWLSPLVQAASGAQVRPNLGHLNSPHLRPLVEVRPFEFTTLDEIQFIQNQFRIVVHHNDTLLL